jgi:hypothetical protein
MTWTVVGGGGGAGSCLQEVTVLAMTAASEASKIALAQ